MYKTTEISNNLPVLDALTKAVSINFPSLKDIAFVFVQHLLYTTLDLLKALIQLGAIPENMHILGKSYSTSLNVVNDLMANGYHYYPNSLQKQLGCFDQYFRQDINVMWQGVYQDIKGKPIKFIVILDDGGTCITHVPNYIKEKYPVVGIEQTSSGLNTLWVKNPPDFPIIEVASSATKKFIESPMIAKTVVNKLAFVLPINQAGLSCAVIGMGAIGVAITNQLLALQHQVITYDKNPHKNKAISGSVTANNLGVAIGKSDYIFGCSGNDITENLAINTIERDQNFISCSSKDIEFLSLLKKFDQENCNYNSVLDDLHCRINNKSLKILRGGFPINFDHSGISVAAVDIQLTRGLLLGGILQGIINLLEGKSQKTAYYMLDPALQQFIITHWMLHGSIQLPNPLICNYFLDYDWIKSRSGGNFQENEYFSRYFSAVKIY